MRRCHVFKCAIVLALIGCGSRRATPEAEGVDASQSGAADDAETLGADGEGGASDAATSKEQVRWFGALYAIMHEGRTEAAVRLEDIVPGPHAWAVGALEGLAGEVTILDDVIWLARPKADGTAAIHQGSIDEVDKNQGAALLVAADVATWDTLPIPAAVPWSGLDAYLESTLTAHGHVLDRPVPVRIDGAVASLRWHVVDGSKMQPGEGHADHARSAVSGVLEEVDAQLVGFFSRTHQGVFTHMGSHSHFHVVTRDGAISGHVDGVDLLPGARLLVPRK